MQERTPSSNENLETNGKTLKETAKEYLDFWPVFTIIFAAFAYWYQQSYYQVFNLDILDYMSYTEVLYRAIEPSLIIGIACVVMFIAIYKSDVHRFTLSNAVTSIVFVLYLLLPTSLMILHDEIFSRNSLWHLIIALIGILIPTSFIYIKFSRPKTLLIIALFGLFVANNLQCFNAKRLIEKVEVRNDIAFIYNGTNVSSNDNLIFIGRCEKYIFLFENSKKKVRVYKTDVADSITVNYNQGLLFKERTIEIKGGSNPETPPPVSGHFK